MQLKIQRSQRRGLTGKILFGLDVRADYSAEERSNINKYALGGEIIYSSQNARKYLEHAGAQLDRTQSGGTGARVSGLAQGVASLALAKMSLTVSIASLGRGHHIECKDLSEMLDAEEVIRNACKELTRYLKVAATFDGSELIIEYVNGEENEHVRQNAPPLLEYASVSTVGGTAPERISRELHAQPLAVIDVQEPQAMWEAYKLAVIKAGDRFGMSIDPDAVMIGTIVALLVLIFLFAIVI